MVDVTTPLVIRVIPGSRFVLLLQRNLFSLSKPVSEKFEREGCYCRHFKNLPQGSMEERWVAERVCVSFCVTISLDVVHIDTSESLAAVLVKKLLVHLSPKGKRATFRPLSPFSSVPPQLHSPSPAFVARDAAMILPMWRKQFSPRRRQQPQV